MLIGRTCQPACFLYAGDGKQLRIPARSVDWKGNIREDCVCQWSSTHLALIFHWPDWESHIVLGFVVGKYISDLRRKKILLRKTEMCLVCQPGVWTFGGVTHAPEVHWASLWISIDTWTLIGYLVRKTENMWFLTHARGEGHEVHNGIVLRGDVCR